MFDESERVARAVISQALSDAGVGTEMGERRTVSQIDQGEARSFLLSSTGAWKQAREFWCTSADLDPEELRLRTMKALGMDTEPDAVPAFPPPQVRHLSPTRLPRPGSKLAQLVQLLNTPEGISLAEMMHTFGWSRVTCSTAVSGDLPAKFGIRSKRGSDNRYRLIEVEEPEGLVRAPAPARAPRQARTEPRPGSKLAAVAHLLRQPEGVSYDEMSARFGWQRSTCSSVINYDLPSNFHLRSERGPDGRYRLIEAP